ncbi:MAG: hypothetical protein H0V56_07620 [Chthoniobacterales bacterium]|nr:hypothetical protein [Chthoniobacterales bacterium]
MAQPIAAQKENCGVTPDAAAMACAACCAVDPCCIFSSTEEAPQQPPITAGSSATDQPVLSHARRAAVLVYEVHPSRSRARAVREAGHVRHSPPPLALNCVQLI